MAKVPTTTAACAAILAAAVLVAGVHPSANSQTRVDTQGDQMRASKILGSAVYTARNTKIGKVSDLIIDKDGRVAAVIVAVAFVGLGEKSVAVKLGDIAAVDDHLILDRSIDELQQMASYRLESENDRGSLSSPNSVGHLTTVPAQ